MSKVEKNEFAKSLERLKGMAQGDVSKSQLHHTPSDSDPGSWAGSSWEGQSEEDSIDEAGTDYAKSIMAKMEKGQPLTAKEFAFAKGMMMPKMGEEMGKGKDMPGKANAPGENKDADSAPPTNAGAEDEEAEGDAKKSLDSYAAKSDEMAKGLDASPFLYELTRAIGHALEGTEARVKKSVAAALAPVVDRISTLEKALDAKVAGDDEYYKSLADAVVGIAEQVSATAENVVKAQSLPVGAPKSQLRAIPAGVQAINKSFDGSEQPLSKSQVSDALVELSKSGKVAPVEVIKFEQSGGKNLAPQVEALVRQHLSGGR